MGVVDPDPGYKQPEHRMKSLILLSCVHLSLSCFFNRPRPPVTTTTAATTQVSNSCRCGVSKTTTNRIVGGVDANKNEFPWQVLLTRSDGSVVCGGSLLSSTTVLTAAHCEGPVKYAVFSEHDVSTSDGEYRIEVTRWENAPGYTSRSYDDDFAIATLKSAVTFSDNVYPICLPTGSSSSYENRDSIVSGWGTTSSGGPLSNILQEAGVKTMTNSACSGSDTQYSSSDITNRMICAAAAGKDACQGDSGGPLVVKKSDSEDYFEQVGVVSWGYGCAQADAPGVYARITSRLSWIQSKVTGTVCPPP